MWWYHSWGWGPGQNRKGEGSWAALISLLSACGCHVTSCLTLLPPCIPSQDRAHPLGARTRTLPPEAAFGKDVVTATRKTTNAVAQHAQQQDVARIGFGALKLHISPWWTLALILTLFQFPSVFTVRHISLQCESHKNRDLFASFFATSPEPHTQYAFDTYLLTNKYMTAHSRKQTQTNS